MPDFEQTLNGILSNPAAMEQIAQLAQSLNASAAVTQNAQAAQNAQVTQNVQAVTQNAQNAPSDGQNIPFNVQDILSAVQNFSSDAQSPAPDKNISPPGSSAQRTDAPENYNHTVAPEKRTAAPSLEELSAALSGSQAFMQFLPFLRELSGQQDSNARRLLYALRPYLNPRRQEKIERALQLAKVCYIGKKFLLEWGNQGV